MIKTELINKYIKLHSLYKESTDKKILDVLVTSEGYIFNNKLDEADKLLGTLKTREQLIDEIMTYIHAKPVNKTLRKISERKASKYESVYGLSSLMTHVAIEASKDKPEYLGILKELHEKIGKLLNNEIDTKEVLS